MKFLRQFMIILLLSFLGEVLKMFIPLPIPASVYGLVLMLLCLVTGILKTSQVKEAAFFLIEIMPVMFIPAAAGLIDSWKVLQPLLLPILVITVVITIFVMVVTGKIEESKMNEMFRQSLFAGVTISLIAYEIGLFLKRKLGLAILNPLLVSIVIVILALKVFGISYEVYNASAKYISYLLTPATVCLAVPLYEQLELLKKNKVAVVCGILSGTLASLTGIFVLCMLFGFNHQQYVTMLPKSITTAIGIGISEELGGIVTITVAVIIITGILGNVIADTVFHIFKIKNPLAKGLALGTASHAIGTARAIEMGPVEGAMSSLAVAVAGLLTVVFVSGFAQLI